MPYSQTNKKDENFVKRIKFDFDVFLTRHLHIAYKHYLFLQDQLGQCDMESEKVSKRMTSNSSSNKKADKIEKSKNNPNFNVSQYLYEALGVEVTKIYGIKEIIALTIFSGTGINLK